MERLRQTRRTFLGTAAAAAAVPAVGSWPGAGAGPVPAGRALKIGIASVLDAQVHARPGARDDEDDRGQVHDLQGRAHSAHGPARGNCRGSPEDRGRRHHHHGRWHDHDEERARSDPEGLRVRQAGRLSAHLRLARPRGARSRRADGAAARHQAGHSQSRPRGQVVPGADRRVQGGEEPRSSHGDLRGHRAHEPHRHRLRAGHRRFEGPGVPTCT